MLKEYSFATFSLDIWGTNNSSPSYRSGIIGFSNIGSICGPNKYSIYEFQDMSANIYFAAQGLGHG
jgi:hypothetical protein